MIKVYIAKTGKNDYQWDMLSNIKMSGMPYEGWFKYQEEYLMYSRYMFFESDTEVELEFTKNYLRELLSNEKIWNYNKRCDEIGCFKYLKDLSDKVNYECKKKYYKQEVL